MNSSPTLGLWELGLKLYGWLSSLENNWLFHKIGEILSLAFLFY